ncbi:MAG: GAF domain-containing protein [Bacteroidales bacterium]|nr:GAF domain-containing protein [Bacteroidales bacterium]
MKLRLLLIASVLLWGSCGISAKKEYRIQNGTLDLSVNSVGDIQNIKLDGYWEFYWNQLLCPQDFQESSNNKQPQYEKVPKSWTAYKRDSIKLPNQGYATYRLLIHKKEDISETIYGLKLSSVFSNYKIWVNGKLLSEVGIVGENKKVSKPKFQYQDVPFILDPDKEDTKQIEIIIQVSNFSHQRAGIQKPIFFGSYENLKRSSRWMDILNLIIIGIILVIGINHLNMYLFRRKAISNLYFSIVCIVMILRNITTADRIITYIFPNINWELLVKLDNFSGFGTIPLFALFIYSLFKVDFPKVMRDIILGIGIVVTLLVFTTPANFYGKFRMFFEIYILIFGLYLTFGVLLKSAIRRRPTAFFTFLGMFILYSTAINDVLSSMGLIQSAYVAPYGLVTFMFIQSITITVKSAKAINQNEELSSELRIEKTNLEKNINERTQELQSQHDELVKHQEKEQEQAWLNNGVSIVNDILADNKDDFKVLSSRVLKQLIKYVGATTGVLYMLNDEDEKDQAFELIADYGCGNDIRKNKSKIHVSTGNYGIVYSENTEIVMNDVPENYIKIESGMGSANPAALLIVPLSIDEKVFGIIELASLKKFTKLETVLIKRIANNIASNLNNIRMNENSAKLIHKFEEQTAMMQEKEEEMRQNLEEMEAIREQYEELQKKQDKK